MLDELLDSGRIRLADGATGTNLFAMGLTSGDAPETWTGKRDAAAGLPDPYELTQATRTKLDDLTFQDLSGRPQRLADPELRGRACVLLIFGSWCPNCHDATRTLTQRPEAGPATMIAKPAGNNDPVGCGCA